MCVEEGAIINNVYLCDPIGGWDSKEEKRKSEVRSTDSRERNARSVWVRISGIEIPPSFDSVTNCHVLYFIPC